MSWFKKNKKIEVKDKIPSLPELPKLPELPMLDVPKADHEFDNQAIPQLPSYPNNSLSEKFSQNAIKDAVTGEKEDKEDFEADEFFDEDEKMMPISSEKIVKRNAIPSDEYIKPSTGLTETSRKTRHAEPVFIRMDKFEESSEVFENAKSKVMEMEEMLRGIKKIKEEEEKELQEWETEIQNIKGHLDKLDRDLFSKL